MWTAENPCSLCNSQKSQSMPVFTEYWHGVCTDSSFCTHKVHRDTNRQTPSLTHTHTPDVIYWLDNFLMGKPINQPTQRQKCSLLESWRLTTNRVRSQSHVTRVQVKSTENHKEDLGSCFLSEYKMLKTICLGIFKGFLIPDRLVFFSSCCLSLCILFRQTQCTDSRLTAIAYRRQQQQQQYPS